MGLETATYVNDLQPTNPTSTDPVNQGDDHLRLIKQVLQNQFQGASKQWAIPTMAVGSGGPINRNQMETTFFCSTASGAATFTLPTGLGAADIGWSCSFFKYSLDANPMFIAPPTGTTLYSGGISVAKARRCIPGVLTKVFYNGAGSFFLSRVTALPVGTLLDYWGSTLPQGFEWPNGQTLVAANYPEYAAVLNPTGATPDLRGYICATLDNLGGAAAGHLPTTYIASGTFGAVGGSDHVALATTNLPPYTPAGSVSTSTSISHNAASTSYQNESVVAIGGNVGTYTPATINASSSSTFSGFAQGGASTPFSTLQPSIMVSKIMIVE